VDEVGPGTRAAPDFERVRGLRTASGFDGLRAEVHRPLSRRDDDALSERGDLRRQREGHVTERQAREDGRRWKIAEPSAAPAILLLERSRLTPQLADSPAENLGATGLALYGQKSWEASAKKYEAAAAADAKDPEYAYNAACSWALAGQPEAALRWLGTAVDRGYDDVKHMQKDPDLDSLRAKPELEAILKRATRP
jgi:hypothetical protein